MSGSGFICVQCNTGKMNQNGTEKHVNGQKHQKKLRYERWKNRVSHVTGRQDQVTKTDRLGLVRWRQHMKELLFDYIFTTHAYACADASPIQRQLMKYTMLEKTSLLELAVWKASCLWFDSSTSFHTMQGILDQCAMEESFDPVAYKAERRFTVSIAIIMRGVIMFLGWKDILALGIINTNV